MKKVMLLVSLLVILAALLAGLRGAVRSAAHQSASSQIYIHGTPVCVMKDGDGIVAQVGECGDAGQGDGEAQEAPFRGSPGTTLPPGHPPVGPDTAPDMTPDTSGRVAI